MKKDMVRECFFHVFPKFAKVGLALRADESGLKNIVMWYARIIN